MCSRRATWIHSQAVLASHEAAAHPESLAAAKQQASSPAQLAPDRSKSRDAMQALQDAEEAKPVTKRKHESKLAVDNGKKTGKVRACR